MKLKSQSQNEDEKWMESFKQGDEDSFEKILNKYEEPLINFIYRYTYNKEDAEDLAQEVFLKVYKSAKHYQLKAKFSTWLYTIAKNRCIDYKRKNKSEPLLFTLDRSIAIGQDEAHSLENEEIEYKIKSALVSLHPRQRLALNLKVYEEKNYQEISRIMGCSVSAVETLLFRARQNLKEKLKDYGKE